MIADNIEHITLTLNRAVATMLVDLAPNSSVSAEYSLPHAAYLIRLLTDYFEFGNKRVEITYPKSAWDHVKHELGRKFPWLFRILSRPEYTTEVVVASIAAPSIPRPLRAHKTYHMVYRRGTE